MPKDRYKGVSLPKDMIEEVERIVKEYPELGYTSVADFVKEAVREKILKLKQTLATTSP
jgi:metal-responsive CopG/Arc/MetJ family transcriptional regulator